MSDKTIRCVRCSSEFSEIETAGINACPRCGSTSVPMSIADDVELKINWHELRVLTIWAMNWIRGDKQPDAEKSLSAIIARLERQFPTKTPLTLEGEMRQLQEEFPAAEMTDSKGNVIVPPKKVQ